jgi:hypothetical protein
MRAFKQHILSICGLTPVIHVPCRRSRARWLDAAVARFGGAIQVGPTAAGSPDIRSEPRRRWPPRQLMLAGAVGARAGTTYPRAPGRLALVRQARARAGAGVAQCARGAAGTARPGREDSRKTPAARRRRQLEHGGGLNTTGAADGTRLAGVADLVGVAQHF